MRELKVRAWDKERKLMLYPPNRIDSMLYARIGSQNGDHLLLSEGHYFSAHMTWDGRCYINGKCQDLIFLQYTGLKDKNGKEIYEGDIVKVPANYGGDHFYKECIGSVNYEEDGFILENPNDKEGFVWQDYSWSNVEIIGNIYENPELLESK